MSELDIRRRIERLSVSDNAAEDRAALALAESLKARPSTSRRPQLAAAVAALGVAVVLAITPAGSAVADAAGELFGGYPNQEAADEAGGYEERLVAFDELLREVAEKAEAGELRADIPPQHVVDVVEGMLNPPSDPPAANKLEDEAIELVEQLRAAGDLPPAGAELPVP